MPTKEKVASREKSHLVENGLYFGKKPSKVVQIGRCSLKCKMDNSVEGQPNDSDSAVHDTAEVVSCKEELLSNDEGENVKGELVVLSKRKQKRLAKHQQWLQRKEEKK